MASRFRQIADDLGARILQGEFAVGAALPSEHRLATDYDAARTTVRRALASLRDEGVLASRQGSAWRVRAARQVQGFDRLLSFAQWAPGRGMVPGGRVVETRFSPATVTERRVLRLGADDEVLHVVRVRSLDGRDVMVERTTYATWVAPAIRSISDEATSVVQLLADRYGILTASAENSVDAVAATVEDARILGVRRSSPLLRVRRVSWDAGGRPIETSEDRYVAEVTAFQVRTTTDAADGASNHAGRPVR